MGSLHSFTCLFLDFPLLASQASITNVTTMADAGLRIQFGDDDIERTKSANGTAYKRRISTHETDAESLYSEKAGGDIRESDYKHRQVRNIIPLRERIVCE